MTSEEANSTIQLLGLYAPAKRVEVKAMSGDNAAIMTELRSLRNDVELMCRSYMRDKSRRIINDECRSEESDSINLFPDDEKRRRRPSLEQIFINYKGKDK